MRIDIPIAEFKNFQLIQLIESYVEFNENTVVSVQRYHSKELNEDDGSGGIMKDYYRDREYKVCKDFIAGIGKEYYELDEVWGVKIHLKNGDYWIFQVPTEGVANKIYKQFEINIFNGKDTQANIPA